MSSNKFNFVNKFTLFQKLIAVMLVLSIGPVVIAGFLTYSTSADNLSSVVSNAASQHAKEISDSIRKILYDTEGQMLFLGLSPSFITALNDSESWSDSDLYATYEGGKFGSDTSNSGRDLGTKDSLPWNPANDVSPVSSQYLQGFVDKHIEYEEIFITNTKGYIVISMDSIPGDFDQDGEEWYKETVAKNAFYEYEFDESTGITVWTVSVKLIDSKENFYGIIKAAYNIDNVVNEFISIQFYGEGFGFIGEKNGNTIAAIGEKSLTGKTLFDSSQESNLMSKEVVDLISDNSKDHTESLFGTFNQKEYIIGARTEQGFPFYIVVLIPIAEYQNPINAILYTLIFSIVIASILAVTISILITRSITSPLKTLSVITEEAANGDLTKEININYHAKDEIGSLIVSFGKMILNLKSTIRDVTNVTDQLASASQELSSSAEEVNASSEEISSVTQQISRGAQEQSAQIMESTKSANQLRVVFDQKVLEINKTASLIEQISSQVNMLALNASIEAARAGECGRGFAVVADNIRNLAENSKVSVVSVQESVNSLKVSLLTSINEIISSIDKVASVAEITASGAEEASAATEEQAATMQELTASSQELAIMASSLEQSISKFKLK
jgi:methyl-accepting chemotaxis protein